MTTIDRGSLFGGSVNAYGWEFEAATMTIDAGVATLDQLEAAIADCQQCIAVEYPETKAGTYAAIDRSDILKDALKRRFPDHAAGVLSRAHSLASAQSKAHYPHVRRRKT